MSNKTPLKIRIGVLLILLAGVLWFSLFAIPFLPLTIAQKTSLAAVQFVGVQIAWWAGAACAGPVALGRLWSWRQKFKPGRNRNL